MLKINAILFSIFFVSQASLAATNLSVNKNFKDMNGDIDNNIKGFCSFNETDLVGLSFKETSNEFIVTFKTVKEINLKSGYKEFYFWLDIDPGRSVGYQPYNPDSVAWPNMYADYRIFMSTDPNNYENKAITRIALQDCSVSDCSQDSGLYANASISAVIVGDTVVFSWPKTLLPRLKAAQKIRFGATSYYQIAQCNGEDDFPQWGDPAPEIRMKK